MLVNIKKNILIVGLGLLGGSYAKGLKRYGFRITAITKEQSSIDYAVEKGIIDEGSTFPDERLIKDADIIIFALYPHVFVEWIKENGKNIKKGALITDVTGVKVPIVDEIQSLLPEGVEFVPAHPMAGREVSGVENSTEEIFKGANYIVTPTDKNTEEGIEACCEIGRLLGFGEISVISPQEHDEMIGFLSQLTHCIAVSLMTCNHNEQIERFTGDSFRDLTRIAKINDEMWSELFLANKEKLLKQMDLFEEQFSRLKKTLENDDCEEMRKIMQASTKRRKKFDKEL